MDWTIAFVVHVICNVIVFSDFQRKSWIFTILAVVVFFIIVCEKFLKLFFISWNNFKNVDLLPNVKQWPLQTSMNLLTNMIHDIRLKVRFYNFTQLITHSIPCVSITLEIVIGLSRNSNETIIVVIVVTVVLITITLTTISIVRFITRIFVVVIYSWHFNINHKKITS